MINADARLKLLVHTAEQSLTTNQFQSRINRIRCIKQHIEDSGGDDELAYAGMIADWPCFAAWELSSKEGIPLFYSEWQERANKLCMYYDDVCMLCARQIGKSVFASSDILRRMCQRPNTNVLLIAPTEEQLIVRDEVNRMIRGSRFINEYFIAGGRHATENTAFGANGSTFHAMNLNVKAEGDTKVGNNGTDVVLDEFQNFTKKSWEEAVQPMLSSAYVRRRVLRIGTAKLTFRPDFDKVWLQARNSEYTGTLNITCWDAIRQGIKLAKIDPRSGRPSPQSMSARFQELKIDCPAVLDHGKCPVYMPEDYLELGGKPGKEWKPGEFPCPYKFACMQNDAFVKEDFAAFPTGADRYFAKSWLDALRRPYRFYTPGQIRNNFRPMYLGIDVGGIVDPGEIVAGELIQEVSATGLQMNKLRVIGWETVQPFTKRPGVTPSTAPTVEAIKRAYMLYHPSQIYIDATHNFELINQLMSEPNPIPPSILYANAPSLNRETRGVYLSPIEKSKVYDWHRTCVATETFIVPDETTESEFWSAFFEAHFATRLRNSTAGYNVFEPHTKDHLTDACALLSIALNTEGGTPPALDLEAIDWNDFGGV